MQGANGMSEGYVAFPVMGEPDQTFTQRLNFSPTHLTDFNISLLCKIW